MNGKNESPYRVEPTIESPENMAVLGQLKIDINEFLFTRLPGSCTLDELDQVAIDVQMVILRQWQRCGITTDMLEALESGKR